ncbi:protein white-like [Oppia nitens]|uniref:protein white-like n=1 Tax=Oppia nitens TaxID=1686743 RepID=UPI0023DBFCDE|nr:protein white-like [Oppia nitens]XP_054159478.1 protein white-like [Oppia nitens]
MSVISEPVSLSWHDINVYTKLSLRKRKKRDPRHILRNVNGQIKAGQLLAIMGASGAGKTTLMNVLTQRNLSDIVFEGTVRLNGRIADANRITALSAYVQQNDLFIDALTVREHLMFQSRVRMDQFLSDKLRDDRINQVMQDFALTESAETRIGKPEDTKGISGGERKRLAFASELLTNPSIMFCDEPTSGLDSFMALSVMEVLRDMAASGRTVICTIHQPSSEVFSVFNQLLLLSNGRVAFLGKSDKAIEFFSSLGLQCPNNYNPSDFYIKQLAIIPGQESQSKEKLETICDRFVDSPYAKEVMPEQICEQFISSSKEDIEYKTSRRVYKSNWIVQFWALLWRSHLTVMREPKVTRTQISQTIFVAVLLGFIYWRLELDQSGILNINGALFLLITNLSFQHAYAVIKTFCIELPLFLREHNNGMYRVSAYFFAKTLAEAPFYLLLPFLFVCIFYYMVGLNSGIIQFLTCALVSVLVANTACSFGYLVSCMSSDVTIALAITPPVMVAFLIFGGYFLNNDSVPIYFIWFKYISFFYYGNEALVINQWQNIQHIACPLFNSTIDEIVDTTNKTITSCIPNGQVVIKLLNFSENNFLRDILALVALILVFRTLAYIALLNRSTRR